MDYHIQISAPTPDILGEIARLWNGNATARHDFFPWSAALLARLLVPAGNPTGRFLTAHHRPSNALIGFIHCNQLREDGYPRAGVVEAVMVDAPYRRHGVGAALLAAALRTMETFRPRPDIVDALGAWPFGYAFNTLADGSERSGVFMNEPDVYRLFRRAGFEVVRQSRVMRADIRGSRPRPIPPGCGFHIAKRTENTWLDRVFRGRELYDHALSRQNGQLLSRAIFGFMEAESRHQGQAVFSLFGVNTPYDQQRKGYAGINLSRLMEHVRTIGGESIEIHVYADNQPALALYDGLGFATVADTLMLHRRM